MQHDRVISLSVTLAAKTTAKARSGGFTVVELLVTLITAGILINAVHTLYVSQTAISQGARDTVIANAYVEGKVEALRSKGYLSLTNGTTDITSELPSELKSPRSASLVISSQSTSVKRIEISVTYSDHGTSRTRQYSTYIGELGVGQ